MGENESELRNCVRLRILGEREYDAGRGVVRVHPKTLEALSAQEGDAVRVLGMSPTAGTLWAQDRPDRDTEGVYLDKIVCRNAGVQFGESARLEPVTPADAKRVVVKSELGNVEFGSQAAAIIKRDLLRRPIVEGDLVPISVGRGQSVPLRIDLLVPGEVCVVTPETTLQISV